MLKSLIVAVTIVATLSACGNKDTQSTSTASDSGNAESRETLEFTAALEALRESVINRVMASSEDDAVDSDMVILEGERMLGSMGYTFSLTSKTKVDVRTDNCFAVLTPAAKTTAEFIGTVKCESTSTADSASTTEGTTSSDSTVATQTTIAGGIDSSSSGIFYPQEVRTSFIEGCQERSAGKNTGETANSFEKSCICAFDALEASLTYTEYVEWLAATAEGEDTDVDMNAIFANC